MAITEAEMRKMTATNLKEWAQENTELVGVTGMKKEELIQTLMEYLGIEPEEKDDKPEKVKIAKKGAKLDLANKKAVKDEILRLKSERDKILENNEKEYEKLKNIRRRIRYLKRVTRKVS